MGRKGFTLVEVVLALALAGLFAYGGAYSFQRLVPKFQLQTGIWEITSGLNQARFRAIMSGAPVRVRFVASGFVFERYDEAAPGWRTARVSVAPTSEPAKRSVMNMAPCSRLSRSSARSPGR